MEQHITPDRIANAIMQESDFHGVYLLVEGIKDIRVYSKFFDSNSVKLKQTHGKYKQRQVYSILSSRNFERKIGIRDADFLRIRGNQKYSQNYSDHIFATDDHDSEVMMVHSGALENILHNISDAERVSNFESKAGKTIRDLACQLAMPVGHLRLANKRYDLGLSFKPERPEGNKIKFKKFICEKKLEFLGIDALINTVFEYSKNRGKEVKERGSIKEKLLEVIAEEHPSRDILNGHDLAEVLFIITKKGLNSSSGILQDSSCIEDILALSFDITEFSKTNLFKQLKTWEATAESGLFRSQ